MPIAVNTLDATFDIQFGNVKRAIHKNTTWDLARFESCGQKWVDLSEDGYGVSVLTDCKYGFSTAYQKIGLSLIKRRLIHIQKQIKDFIRLPILSMFMKVTGKKDKRWKKRWHSMYQHMYWQILMSSKSNRFSLLIDNNVLLDSVKKAEADEAVVVRLYEYHNRKTTCRLTVS